MAEGFLVIFDTQGAGDATAGYKWSNQTEASSNGPVEIGRIVEVQAGSAQEAITGVRRAYGDGMVTGAMKVAKTSGVESKTA